MQNFFKIAIKILIISLPALIVLAYIETGLSKIDTHYITKLYYLESQKDSVQILSLGSSNAYFGINPEKFSCKGFNFAINAQSMYYDLKIFELYTTQLPKLKLVILPAIFYTTGTNILETSQDWRIFFYKQYLGLPLEDKKGRYFQNLKRSLDSRNYSKIALFGDTVGSHVNNGFTGHLDYTPNLDGWYDSTQVPKLDSKRNYGLEAANAHNSSFQESNIQLNLSYWQQLIDILKKRNVQVIIIRLPEHESYYKNLDSKKQDSFTEALKSFSSKNGIPFADYSRNKSFTMDDFTSLPDHLNPQGADKFSALLDSDFVKSVCF